MMEFDKIKTVISEQMGIEEASIAENTRFVEDLGADSLEIFQVISELEEIFGIEFTSDSAEQIKTVGDAAKYIQANLNK